MYLWFFWIHHGILQKLDHYKVFQLHQVLLISAVLYLKISSLHCKYENHTLAYCTQISLTNQGPTVYVSILLWLTTDDFTRQRDEPCPPDTFVSIPGFVILLWQTKDDFTRQGGDLLDRTGLMSQYYTWSKNFTGLLRILENLYGS